VSCRLHPILGRILKFYQPAGAAVQRRDSAAMISSMSRRGKFISFEGLDGTGKSTQTRKLADALRAAGHKVIETREPGGTATGEKIRRVLLDSKTEGLSPLAEMALMFGARAQHIAEVIEPALNTGQIVLCDRFTDSTEAYQGAGRKLGSESVLNLHRILCGDLQPDLTILLDSDPEMSVGRARRRNRRASRGRYIEQAQAPCRREPLRARDAGLLRPRARRLPCHRSARAGASRRRRC
jgi:dTMP kinase